MSDIQKNECDQADVRMPWEILIAPIFYLILLVIALAFWGNISSFKLLGMVPIILVWAGILGGTLSSLQGIFIYNKKWNHSYDHWHVFSGLIGAAFAIVSYFFLIAIVKTPSPTLSSSTLPIYVLAAFVLGYGQRQFHSLINTAFTLIFHPANKPAAKTGGALDMTLHITSDDAKITQTK